MPRGKYLGSRSFSPSTTIGPIVIVIDAFDESGDEASRRVILSILANRISELPPNLRVLVTTRRESDIDKAFDSNSHVHCKHMDTIDTNSTNNDITAFIRDSLDGAGREMAKPILV
jgi:hypothetical protein